jgi:long-chain acyl-CoA synthetase
MRRFIWNPWLMSDAEPERPAVITRDEVRTFADLVTDADRYSAGLASAGVPEGSVVATDLPSGPALFALVLAALRDGYGLFPVDHGHSPDVRRRLLAQAGAVLEVVAGGGRPKTGSEDGPPAIAAEDLLASPASPAGTARRRAGHLVFVSSGTTGDPKVVVRARPLLPYQGVAVDERYHSGPAFGPHVMSNATYHLGTLGPALYALQAGSAVVVQDEWSVVGFADLVDRHSADTAFLSPNFVGDVVRTDTVPRRQLLTVFHGGFACPSAVKRRAIDLLGPVLHEFYGTSEAVITEIDSVEWLRRPGSVGRPLPGVRVEVHDGGAPLPAGRLGEIVVSLRAADRPGAAPLATGDLGYLDGAGYLFVAGRATADGGAAGAQVEQRVREIAGVEDVAVLPATGQDQRPVVLVETLVDEAFVRSQIDAVMQCLPGPDPVVLIGPPGSFARTRSGKLRRTPAADEPADAPAADAPASLRRRQ